MPDPTWLDERTRRRAHEAVQTLAESSLSAEQWSKVNERLGELEQALEAHDLSAVRSTLGAIEDVRPEVRRFVRATGTSPAPQAGAELEAIAPLILPTNKMLGSLSAVLERIDRAG